MHIRRALTLGLLLTASYYSLAGEPVEFKLEGFYLGMSREDATAVRPQTPWKRVMRGTPSEVVRKEFMGTHMERETEVTVDLSPSEELVRVIGFAFKTTTDQQCITDAMTALAKLEALYGEESEVLLEQPGKRAKWVRKDGSVVRWLELCASGAQRYIVTYASGGG